MNSQTVIEKTMQHHQKIMEISKELAKPTEKKANLSFLCGGAILLCSLPAKLFSSKIALGLCVAGVVQLTTSTVLKKYLKNKD